MAFATPNSAKDNIAIILVNSVCNPKSSMPKYLINKVLKVKLRKNVNKYETKLNCIFLKLFFTLINSSLYKLY